MKAEVTCSTKILLTIISFSVLTSYSGQWEVFTAKNDVRDIALTGNTLWAATTGGVVAWNLDDNSYKSYTTEDGLASCYVSQVAIDKKGRPWVVTNYPTGLFAYENHVWKQMNVGGADHIIGKKIISGLEVDQFGNVWVDTRHDGSHTISEEDLWRYDGQTWHKHKGVNGPLALDLHNKLLAVGSISLNKDVLRDQFEIVSFNGSEFVSKWSRPTHETLDAPVLTHFTLDSKGNPWFSYHCDRSGTGYGVVCDNIHYNTLDGLADDNVRSITADESGTVWCATAGGISKFTGAGWVTYDTTKGVASNLIYKILIGSDNTLYAATSKGISTLKSNRFKKLKTINEPLHNNYTDIVVDKRGAVILAGYDHIAIYNDLQWKLNSFRNIYVGKSRYGYHYFQKWKYGSNKSFIKSNDGTVYAIGNEDKKGWILKQRTGASTFFKAYSFPFERNNFYMFMSPAVASSGNNSCFWLTGGNFDYKAELILFNNQKYSYFPLSRFGYYDYGFHITCMLLDRDERSVWFGLKNNEYGWIIHFDGDSVKKRIPMDNKSGWATAIARDSSQNLWFASNKSGVTVLRDTGLARYFKDSDGKMFGGCNALFVDRSGTVWTHSENGIARFDGKTWKLFESEVVSPDLPYANYSYIVQDKSGTVWFGTERRVLTEDSEALTIHGMMGDKMMIGNYDKVSTEGSGLLAYKDNRWYQFTQRDGIPHNSIRGLSLDNNDKLWILTDNGIAMSKSDRIVKTIARHNHVNPGKKQEIKQHGSRFFVSSKDKPKMVRYILFDLRGRVVLRQTIHGRKSFEIPEKHFGSGLRILSITTEDIDGYQNKYVLKTGDIK